MSDNEHVTAIRDNADISHDQSAIEHRANYIAEFGGSSLTGTMAHEIVALMGNIRSKHDALATQLAEAVKDRDEWRLGYIARGERLREAEARPHQISVVYTCCAVQEYWPLNAYGELEMDHSELGAVCGAYTGTYQDRMDDLRRKLAEAEARCQRKDAYIARIAARLDAVRRALDDAPGDTEGEQ